MLFRATPAAYEGFQARDRIRAVAAGQHHSHSNVGSKPHLPPTPQLTATQDPGPTERGQRFKLTSSWILVRFITTEPQRELQFLLIHAQFLAHRHT